MKIVLNKRYGGFSISPSAMAHMAHLKGINLYREEDEFGYSQYFTTPTFEDGTEFTDRPEDRTDPDLIATIEALGDLANGDYARLVIRDLHSGQLYRICEYDGKEWLEFPSDIAWSTAV